VPRVRRARKDRHQEKDGALREGIAHDTSRYRDSDIPGVIESRVTTHAAGQLLARVKAECQSSDGRPEDIADHGNQTIGDQNRPEAGQGEDRHRSQRECGESQNDYSALSAGFINRSANRRLRGEAEQAPHHGYKTGYRLAPMLLHNEKNIEIRPERAAHISQKEIDGIERERMKASRFSYSDSRKIPIVSVTTVRSAPTLK